MTRKKKEQIKMYCWLSEYKQMLLTNYKSSFTARDLGMTPSEYDDMVRRNKEIKRKRELEQEANDYGLSVEGYNELLSESKSIETQRIQRQRTKSGIGESSSSSTPVLETYMCPILGDHIGMFTRYNSVTRVFYKSHGSWTISWCSGCI